MIPCWGCFSFKRHFQTSIPFLNCFFFFISVAINCNLHWVLLFAGWAGTFPQQLVVVYWTRSYHKISHIQYMLKWWSHVSACIIYVIRYMIYSANFFLRHTGGGRGVRSSGRNECLRDCHLWGELLQLNLIKKLSFIFIQGSSASILA